MIGKQTLKKLTKLSLKGMMILLLLLLTSCGWRQSVIIPSDRVLECPEDITANCEVSRSWLLERYETERSLLRQLEECREN